jgi:hypothetical protein
VGLGKNLPNEIYVRTYFAQWPAPTVDWYDVALVTINTLPDVALLEIFDFFTDEIRGEEWHTLVHVCQKWRNVAFGSPRRLRLILCCKATTPVKETLDVWPPLPIAVSAESHEM